MSENHPDYATSLHDLGHLHLAQKQYEEAEKCFQKALEIRKRYLGERHPDCAYTLYGLALNYLSEFQDRDPQKFLTEALIIFEERLGPRHPDTQACRKTLGA